MRPKALNNVAGIFGCDWTVGGALGAEVFEVPEVFLVFDFALLPEPELVASVAASL